eukprot:8146749-Heterocapsa_arctica.AAC.1
MPSSYLWASFGRGCKWASVKLVELEEVGPEAALDVLAETDIDSVPFNEQVVLCQLPISVGRECRQVACWWPAGRLRSHMLLIQRLRFHARLISGHCTATGPWVCQCVGE